MKYWGQLFIVGLFSMLFTANLLATPEEPIAVGVLTRGEINLQNIKIGNFAYSIDFSGSDYNLIYFSAMVTENQVALTDHSLVFRFERRDIDDAYAGDRSVDGNIYMVVGEDVPQDGVTQYNLAFLEINAKKQFRVSFHFGVKNGYRSQGKFLKTNYNKEDPLAASKVVTTKWHDVE